MSLTAHIHNKFKCEITSTAVTLIAQISTI